ncbi:MAG: S49 family peptidase [Alphaproteobacteria bacterium]|nr:S49 family peptidase [Alphaproteobacteria bacterium]
MSVKNKVCETCDAFSSLPLIGGLLKPKEKVAVIRLSGVIADSSVKRGGISHARYEKTIEQAFETYNLKAVALVINSPGGSPAQSALVAGQIRALAEDKDVPVYAFVEDVAASGGYWLACAADEIYATDVSIIGSIGVISSSFGFKELIGRYGIERRVHTSGKDKSFLDPFEDEKPGDVKRLKALQSALHARFIDWVKTRRGEKLTGSDKALFEGEFWESGAALELGLIDGIGEMKALMKETFGDEVKFVDFGPERALISSLVGADAKANIANDLAETLETRALWARFGL